MKGTTDSIPDPAPRRAVPTRGFRVFLDDPTEGDDRGDLVVRIDPSTLAWLLPTSLLVLAIVSVPLLVLDERGLPRYRMLRDEEAELQHQNEALRLEVRALSRDVEALRSDESSVERIARDELGMVRPGEILFQFPE